MNDPNYLTLDVLIAIHDNMIEEYGGSHGIRDITLIQSALARPQASFGGDDLYQGIFPKTTALFHSLLFNHPFIDGNKRTAMAASAYFLHLNGYELEASQKEFVSFPLKVKKEHMNFDRISSWFRKHAKKIK